MSSSHKKNTSSEIHDGKNTNDSMGRSSNNTKNGSRNKKVIEAIRGPDLNSSRSPLDTKLYRQILLPNGLRAVLISDTVAIQRQGSACRQYDSDNDDDDDDEEDKDEKDEVNDADSDEDSDADSDDGVDEEESGLRNAAAAIVVGAGSMHEPTECQGLAHFLEHLLFMGSKKYPAENDYEAFVSKHGGSDNAWTEWEYTAYNLTIPQEYLWPALDRLAQFFIDPLLLESAVERELLSIESEFQLNKQNANCRWHQLMCATTEPGHPMAKFSWGNLQSLKHIPNRLGVDPMEKLREFYDTYYYASNTRLVVMGAYSLDEMEKQIVQMFSPVPTLPRNMLSHQNLPVDNNEINSWTAQYRSQMQQAGLPLRRTIGKLFRCVPVKDRHSLKLIFQLPSQIEYWKYKPADFIAHMLGHEANGSLLSYFRQKSWALSCMAGMSEEGSEQASSHAFFTVMYQLSTEGLDHWQEIVEATFSYIGMLQHYSQVDGWPEHLYEELRRVQELSYRFGDEQSPEDTVEAIVVDLAPHWNLPPERLLDGSHLMWEFDPDVIQTQVLSHLRADNVLVNLTSTTFGRPSDFDVRVPDDSNEILITDLQVLPETGTFDPKTAGIPQIEPMFGTLFWCHEIPAEMIERWTTLSQPQMPSLPLHLPLVNPYIPKLFDLKPLPEDDADHPLLNASLKLCVAVGKKKQWFPATVLRYNSKSKSLLLQYEDDEQKWHKPDQQISSFTVDVLTSSFEGTMDQKKTKYRLVALSQPGEGPTRKFGDESDYGVIEGNKFPPIPPALPPARLPKLIHDDNTLKMWYLQDRNFHRPIADLRIQLNCADANKTPLHRACAELMVDLVADACLETAYIASICELGSCIETSDTGFYLRFHGFDDKLLVLTDKVISCLLSFCGAKDELPKCFTKDRFDACLEELHRKYRNANMSANQLASTLRLRSLRQTKWSTKAKADAIDKLAISSFLEVASCILQRFAIEAFYHGNVDRSDANNTKDFLLKIGSLGQNEGLPRKKYPSQSVTRIPIVSTPLIITVPAKDLEELNTAVELYVQVGKDCVEDRVMIDLLVNMMDEPLYDQLRTKDQFGYDVHCDIRWSLGITGLLFKVVTSVKSAAEVMDRLDRFLVDFRQEIINMSDKSFKDHVVGLATQKLDMFNSLPEETESYWAEIRDGRFEWQAWRTEALFLRSVTKDAALDAFDRWLNPENDRACLGIQVIGYGNTNASLGRPDVEIENVESYYEEQIEALHNACNKQTWGRVNCKLF